MPQFRAPHIAAAGVTAAAAFLCLVLAGDADEARYRKPPAAIESVLRAPALPVGFVAPDRRTLLLARPLRYPPIADLAKPMLRLAGMRIDPANNGIHHAPSYDRMTLVHIADGRQRIVHLRPGVHASAPQWSPDGSRFAFADADADATRLNVVSVASGSLQTVPGLRLNDVFRNAMRWMPNGDLLVYAVPSRRSGPPRDSVAPAGPVVQETTGKKAPAVTFEDLLQSPHDADLWQYYASGIPTMVHLGGMAGASRAPALASARVTAIAPEGIYREMLPAPDGKHLLVDRIVRPFSFAVPYQSFAHEYAVLTLSAGGALAAAEPKRIAAVPLQTNATFDVVPAGPRAMRWREDKPASLVWVEALDNGESDVPAPLRDAVKRMDVGAASETVIALAGRFRGLEPIAGSDLAIVRDYDREARLTHTRIVNLDSGAVAADMGTLRDGDRYHDPGAPIAQVAADGAQVVVRDGDAVFLRGLGAGPEGQRPFLDRYDFRTRKATRLFQSELEPIENVIALLDAHGGSLLVSRQSPVQPPNFTVRASGASHERDLTAFTDPAPVLRSLQRRIVNYKRPDGVALSFVLYLPPGYKEGTRLPTFVWAYPAEFNDPSVAAQQTNSAQNFVSVGGASQVFMALAGYAVLDNAAVPILGDPRTVNDTFVEQLTADMKAAIDKAVDLGVTDPERVAVGGHSYGAFMTANLLAHTRLFRAGIARSGAYNRTLTPFGFQNERRTFWEAPDLYVKMSPFTYADKIADPLLMIHGVADDNTGTFPLQSERLFAAIRGTGGTARLVMLPDEAHGYLARESIETTLAEMVDWLDRYVKSAPSRARPPGLSESS